MLRITINTVCNGSIGGIMREIQIAAQKKGFNTVSFYGRRTGYIDLPCEKFGNSTSFWIHVIINTLFDRQGFASFFSTRYLIKRLRNIHPDIIHLHNLHGYYINLPLLFNYLRDEFDGEIVWTFHDCWPITGHCPYFTLADCKKWMVQCEKCPQKKLYPISLGRDASEVNYKRKKELFSNLHNLTIICPSKWMVNLVAQSYLKETNTVLVSNGIDLETFRFNVSTEILDKYHIPLNKKIILGVANIWEKRKGLDDFIALSKKLPESYRIILVGLNKRQIRRLPYNIVGIERTENRFDLVKLYSIADVFINPSVEESFSLVTIEAMACGTPVIALDTSAVKELVSESNGILLHEHKDSDYLSAIAECENHGFDRGTVRKTVEKYDKKNMTNRILELYHNVLQ